MLRFVYLTISLLFTVNSWSQTGPSANTQVSTVYRKTYLCQRWDIMGLRTLGSLSPNDDRQSQQDRFVVVDIFSSSASGGNIADQVPQNNELGFEVFGFANGPVSTTPQKIQVSSDVDYSQPRWTAETNELNRQINQSLEQRQGLGINLLNQDSLERIKNLNGSMNYEGRMASIRHVGSIRSRIVIALQPEGEQFEKPFVCEATQVEISR